MLDRARSMLKYREEARTAARDSADWLNSINDANGALMPLGRLLQHQRVPRQDLQ